MPLRTTCPDCESPLVLFAGLNALHEGGMTLTCDRVRVEAEKRVFDPCGFAVHLTREELLDAVLRAGESKAEAEGGE